jgi:segregation and condensation protein B
MSEEESVQDDQVDESEMLDSERDEGDAVDSPQDFGDWGGDDLEAAYLKAMSALEASDLELPPVPSKTSSIDAMESDVELDRLSANVATKNSSTDGDHSSSTVQANSIADLFSNPATVPSAESGVVNITPAETRMTPRQIIEACLFVGGAALTAQRLSGVLRGEFNADYVDREINELNRRYAAESRPYEIRLGDGGYRLALRDEFERIRHKVYGLGPKEVRLSQEALEVLAVVAYHQPIKQSRVEELGKSGCGPVLRQLVRRELLAVERDPEHPRDVNYKTTSRFLSLFGIRNLDELPRHEQVAYK